MKLVKYAERCGFPTNCCGWIRGIYGGVMLLNGIDAVIAVTGGDCSNTHALAETFRARDIRIIPFSFPIDRSPQVLGSELVRFASALGTDLRAAEDVRRKLVPLRRKLRQLDSELAQGRATYEEFHAMAVASSDFNGDPIAYESQLDALLADVSSRMPQVRGIPITLLGVPPIITDFSDLLDSCGLRVVLDEIPRQFCMDPDSHGLTDQYIRYTYPYGITGRLPDIIEQSKARGSQGIIHYTQSFCFRAIEDVVLRERVDLPVLTVEGDDPGRADERLRLRLESFAEMLRGV
jgi:benzoyl-CoA reductase/2-hydroxyglutaryl-CoA dehydratase subunit BcrC/BadD/HgdB